MADASVSFEITGLGDVLEPKDGVIAIGSGGTFALGPSVCLVGWGWGTWDGWVDGWMEGVGRGPLGVCLAFDVWGLGCLID